MPLEAIFILSDELTYGLIYTMPILQGFKAYGKMEI
jgi:hypothetical protein